MLSKPAIISTFPAGNGCFLGNEGTVVRDFTVPNFYLGIYNVQGSVQYNTGTNYNAWNTPGRALDPNPCSNGYQPQGDPWVTATERTSLFYASTLVRPCAGTPGGTQMAIAGSTRALLSDGSATNGWQTPLTVVTTNEPNVDGPSIEYNLGGNTLYATYRSNGVSLRSWGPCTGTDVGGPGCPVLGARIAGGVGASAPVSTSLRGHSAQAVNYFSGNAIVAWREDPTGPLETSPSPVKLATFGPDSDPVFRDRQSRYPGTSRSSYNTNCPRGANNGPFNCAEGNHVCGCNGTLGTPNDAVQCPRVAPSGSAVNMAIVQTPTTRILYVAYDTDCDGQQSRPPPPPRAACSSRS